ncbi:MAG: hypothetical protein A3F33_02240 [Candidatus Woykebacteria bacterium RIFCSPHIGHO2_12_FULL_43_10]|uniref:PEGA domain-containing protein n=2 Tax=Candidatus Woykeibacteriota TaxID=1817899 RepID=A0A1G1WY01_9BACT|nr:MAG: hypothetical protein A2802_00460 [Candidatus Woykebacteria bacterium RIFCSPHIGHO2_01_FULL_43_29]OGY29425.1 MAG: hypothetical protein A3J50_00105 [Candidatus Woykebacteria bacterium RIFCSPHIGHO2_02_FULL_43_16b]OGY29455.1 MAG: hypothetical protein A3F33_02240 [Candidatus Woykebacteria bacterium RIFCSPHIGHO2_12_FULL_43_10]OGY32648.1 MAG: hypothetical protein A3A61_04115 [Candidatus Woykebacteria bacterium RIFCSPLOWO2_01_FULL_43_14]
MNRYYLGLLATVLTIIAVSTVLIFQAKGYKLDFENKRIEKTGILAISSVPTGAAVYLNGHLISATNANIQNLTPGEYHLKVTKEGFISWEKKVLVSEELVTLVEIALFPAVPDLSPLTFTGSHSPKLSPDGQKIVYALRNGEKSGLWVLDLADKPVFFSKEPKQIAKDSSSLSFSDSTFSWTPDSKTVLVTLQENSKEGGEYTRTYLLVADQLNNERLSDITTTIERTKKTWADDYNLKKEGRISKLVNIGAQELATKSANIAWSLDEKRFLVYETEVIKNGDKEQTKLGKAKVYDSKLDKTFTLPDADSYVWYPDSAHLILVADQSISIIEYTGENRSTIYSGNFDPTIIFPSPNGSKLIILSSFNQSIKEPNLYTINLQ